MGKKNQNHFSFTCCKFTFKPCNCCLLFYEKSLEIPLFKNFDFFVHNTRLIIIAIKINSWLFDILLPLLIPNLSADRSSFSLFTMAKGFNRFLDCSPKEVASYQQDCLITGLFSQFKLILSNLTLSTLTLKKKNIYQSRVEKNFIKNQLPKLTRKNNIGYRES